MHACIPGVAQGSGYTSMQPAHILRVTNLHKMMMMMPFHYSYRNENVRTLSLAECTRMHACIHALIMYNAYASLERLHPFQ